MRRKYVIPFEESLDPSNEDIDATEPDLDDILPIAGSEDTEGDPDEEYIFGPKPDILPDAVGRSCRSVAYERRLPICPMAARVYSSVVVISIRHRFHVSELGKQTLFDASSQRPSGPRTSGTR
ncbi:hypothetical protein N7513_001951 [Penicillium frequentans]|nr:hypothetical protein N7513_001951 [Penicillium glabrum]